MPASCPCTGLPCSAWICNAGGWPCDPAPMQALRDEMKNPPAPLDDIEETEDGLTLGVEVPDDGEVDF